MKRMILLTIALAALFTASQAAVDTVWTRTYGNNASSVEYAFGCALDNNGYIYIIGSLSLDGTAYSNDFFVIKYNTGTGDTVWTRSYNGSYNQDDYGRDCAIDDSGYVYVTGDSYSNTTTTWDYMTIKINPTNGDPIWTRRYNSPFGLADNAKNCVTNGGFLYVAGYSSSTTSADYLIIKYDVTTGDTIWTKRYDNNDYNDLLGGCIKDNNNRLYITGTTNYPNYRVWTLALDANGDTLWSALDSLNNSAESCEFSNDTLYIIGSASGGGGKISKYDTTGTMITNTNYSFAGAPETFCVDSNGNQYVPTNANLSGNVNIYTMAIKPNGDTLWTAVYNGPANNNDGGSDCVVDSLRNVYICGYTSNGVNNDLLLIKYKDYLGIPVLLKPQNDTAFTINNPTFIWHAVDYATSYRLQASPTANFSVEYLNTSLSDTTYTPTSMLNNWYYWRVKAYSAADSSDWSEVRQFSISTAALPAPALLFPPADTVTNDSFPNFDWTDVSGASRYQVQAAIGYHWVFASYYFGALYPFNASDPSQLLMGAAAGTGNADDVAIMDTFAIVAQNNSLRTFNITNPAAPAYVGDYGSYGYVRSIKVRDSLVYVADGNAGLYILNYANPAAPSQAGYFDSPGYCTDVALKDTLAYLADGGSGLRIVNLANIAAPAEIGSLASTYAYGVALSNGYAYLADNSSLRVIDVANPAAPVQAGILTGMSSARDVAVRGNLAYLADGGGGLRIINVANPASPQQLGVADSANYDCQRVVLADSVAYVADRNVGLLAIDVTDPYNPRERLRYGTSDITGVAVLDSFAPVWFDSAVTASACEPDTFPADGLRCWRARAGAGAWGAWSAPRRFTFDTQPPNATWITAPGDNQLINDPTPALACYNYGGDRHRFQAASDTAFAAVELDTVVAAVSCTLQAALPDGRHYLRVRAGDYAGNWAAWSARTSFRLDSTPPGPPTAVTANGANPSVWTRINDFNINLTPPIDSSGIQYYYYKVGAAPSSNFDTTGDGRTNSLPLSITAPADGATPLYIWASDLAGNLDYHTAAPVVMRYDHIAPAGARALANEFSRTAAFGVSWNTGADQGGSGLNGRYYLKVKINSGAWTDVDNYYAGTSYTHTGVQGSKYYFEVAALDSAGNCEAFTAVPECSTLVDNTLTCPILVAPYNGAIRDSAATAFLWQRATAQAGSRLQCSYDPSFAAVAWDTVRPADSTVALTLSDSLYYWRVRGQNTPLDTSTWSPARTLRIDTQAPAAPFLASPGPDTVTNNNRPVFVWKPEAGASRYRLQLGADSALASPLRDVVLDSTAYTPDVTLADSVWHWRVRAGDAAGNWSVWSERWSLTVDTRAPAVPEPFLPAEGAALVTALPQFAWGAAATAVSYSLQAAGNTSFSPLQLDTTVADTAAVPAQGLSDGAHYWRVRSRDAAGNQSAWCAYRSFGINALLQVAAAIPGAGQLWAPGSAVWITFSKPVYAGHIDTAHIRVTGKFTPRINRYFSYDNPTRTLKIAPDTAFAALDSVTVTLSGTLLDSASTTTLDGNNSGAASGDTTDNYRLAFVTSWVGDFNRDLAVGGADLAMFAAAWTAPYDRYYEAGPASGAWPHPRVAVGTATKLDFEDVAGFIYSWNRADGPKLDGPAKGGPLVLRADAVSGLISVDAAPGTAFAAIDAELDFDPAALSLLEIAPAALWIEPGKPRLFLTRQGTGRAFVSAARWDAGEAAGALFTARFNAARSIQSEVVMGYTLYDARGQAAGSGRASLLWNAAPALPLSFAMGRAAPNPAFRAAQLSYQLPRREQVRLEIYNIAGQRVVTLVNEQQPAGYYAPAWNLKDRDGRKVGGGVYFYKLTAGAYRAVGKLTVIR